jgi:hypothetical protein
MSGARLGPYEIAAQIGIGGMGEVYRATDTNLGREVAIKVLPESVASDPERLARFEREARLLASLNHPNIAAIYGLERAASMGRTALVMELVEGPTLADRIAGAPVPADEALPIARQIADALEAAHEHGIVHRDLKPANIKVRGDGAVKVLDFGLAKAMEPVAAASSSVSMSPTITTPAHLRQGYGGQAMTEAGLILGTAAYMSPEQARGRPVDKRADIWAFGVLFEMLSGRAAFPGGDVTDILAAIVRGEPEWNSLPADTAPRLRELLERCLEKDARNRWHDIADVRLEIQKVLDDPEGGRPVVAGSEGVTRRAVLGWGTAALGGAGIGAVVGWSLGARNERGPRSEAARLEIATPSTPEPASVAISPAGRSVVFVAFAGGISRLWLRPMNSTGARPIAGTENASRPFWKPDSGAVGFFADGWLKRVDLETETVQQLARAPIPRGAAWSPEGTILFVPSAAALWRIPERGGEDAWRQRR